METGMKKEDLEEEPTTSTSTADKTALDRQVSNSESPPVENEVHTQANCNAMPDETSITVTTVESEQGPTPPPRPPKKITQKKAEVPIPIVEESASEMSDAERRELIPPKPVRRNIVKNCE